MNERTLKLTDQDIDTIRKCIDLAVKNADRPSVRVLVALDIRIENQLADVIQPDTKDCTVV